MQDDFFFLFFSSLFAPHSSYSLPLNLLLPLHAPINCNSDTSILAINYCYTLIQSIDFPYDSTFAGSQNIHANLTYSLLLCYIYLFVYLVCVCMCFSSLGASFSLSLFVFSSFILPLLLPLTVCVSASPFSGHSASFVTCDKRSICECCPPLTRDKEYFHSRCVEALSVYGLLFTHESSFLFVSFSLLLSLSLFRHSRPVYLSVPIEFLSPPLDESARRREKTFSLIFNHPYLGESQVFINWCLPCTHCPLCFLFFSLFSVYLLQHFVNETLSDAGSALRVLIFFLLVFSFPLFFSILLPLLSSLPFHFFSFFFSSCVSPLVNIWLIQEVFSQK